MELGKYCPHLRKKVDSRNYRLARLMLTCSQLGFEPLYKIAGVTNGQSNSLVKLTSFPVLLDWHMETLYAYCVLTFLAKHLTQSLRIPGKQDEEISLDLKYKAQRGWYF